jgi:site-specific DNA-methyltransferase (adenine-specific)
MRDMPDGCVDSIVTDPPAGISFMGKSWDGDRGGRDQWVGWMETIMRECLRVIKPGGHILVWALPRTSHWTAWAIESSGFDVRDIIMHIFGSGFPKSLDVSKAIDKAAGAEREVVGLHERADLRKGKAGFRNLPGDNEDRGAIELTAPATDSARQWSGWGTALKPAAEHWILARKPLGEQTVAANVLKHDTGAINVDGCRVEGEPTSGSGASMGGMFGMKDKVVGVPNAISNKGRWPANIITDGSEEVVGGGSAQQKHWRKWAAKPWMGEGWAHNRGVLSCNWWLRRLWFRRSLFLCSQGEQGGPGLGA